MSLTIERTSHVSVQVPEEKETSLNVNNKDNLAARVEASAILAFDEELVTKGAELSLMLRSIQQLQEQLYIARCLTDEAVPDSKIVAIDPSLPAFQLDPTLPSFPIDPSLPPFQPDDTLPAFTEDFTLHASPDAWAPSHSDDLLDVGLVAEGKILQNTLILTELHSEEFPALLDQGNSLVRTQTSQPLPLNP